MAVERGEGGIEITAVRALQLTPAIENLVHRGQTCTKYRIPLFGFGLGKTAWSSKPLFYFLIHSRLLLLTIAIIFPLGEKKKKKAPF